MGAMASPVLQRERNSALPANHAPQLGRLLLTPARTGDQLAIHHLLQQIFRGPSAGEFQAQQDEPGYMPGHRLVVRDGHAIVGHARVSFREVQIAGEWLPVARVFDLCVAPEFRKLGLAGHLLSGCEQMAREHNVALMQARSPRPHLFERAGWFAAGRASYSLAGPREVLAEMERQKWESAALHQASDDLPQLNRARHPLTVRRWKQTEHAAVQRLYSTAIAGLNGPLARSDEYWHWLISRQAYDWFYVAIDGPDRTLFDDIQGHIVGYMFLKGNRVVEMMSTASQERACEAMLLRACRDAIEQSATPIRLDAPPNHPLHAMFAAAGGKLVREPDAGEMFLAKVLDLPRLANAALCELPVAARLTLQLCEEAETIPLLRETTPEPTRWLLEAGKLTPDHSSARPQVMCTPQLFAQLLLGHATVAKALETQQLRTNNRAVGELLEQLIEPSPLWFAPLEDLLG